MAHQSCNRIACGLAVLVACVSAIIALNVLNTTPRFDYPPLNYAAVILLALSVPAVIFWLAFAALSSGWRWVVALIASVISIPIGIFCLFASLDLQSIVATGVDTSFEPLAELRGEHYNHRVYRTNGGATTSFGIVLRREYPLLLGLKLVTIVRSYYPAHDATLERLPSGQARLSVEAYGRGRTNEFFEFSP